MRFSGWALLLLVLGLAMPAPAAVTWTCTRDNSSAVQAGFYFTTGNCTASGTYTTGGDFVGASAALPEASKTFCETPQQILKNLLVSGGQGAKYEFNLSTFLLQGFVGENGGTTGTLGVELANATSITGALIRFFAICK